MLLLAVDNYISNVSTGLKFVFNKITSTAVVFKPYELCFISQMLNSIATNNAMMMIIIVVKV